MAHAAQLNVLTDELVEIIAAYSPLNNTRAFRACKQAASKNLRNNSFARTNQFTVRSNLEGLIEKFQIFNNDPLADELQYCLDKLETRSYKWKPEVLSLLLLLSDRPAEKTNLNSTDVAEIQAAPTPLTWQALLADDPIIEKDMWRDIDRDVPDLSEDEATLDFSAGSDHADMTSPSSVCAEDEVVNAESLVIPVDIAIVTKFDQVQNRQRNVTASGRTLITELQAVREVLHMLLGLPSIFTARSEGQHQHAYAVKNASQASVDNLLLAFTSTAGDVEYLRAYTRKIHKLPLLQSFSACIRRWVQNFDAEVVAIEQVFVGIKQPCVVSLLSVNAETSIHVAIIRVLKEIIMKVERLRSDQAFELLDELFHHACHADTIGDQGQFHLVGEAFFACLQTYMKPLLEWMVDGHLQADDLLCPFRITNNSDPSKLWSDQFVIHKTDGKLSAPSFLHAVLERIFASGKDVALLRALGLAHMIVSDASTVDTALTFDELYHFDPDIRLIPFSARLDEALQIWVSSNCRKTWSILRTYLCNGHGLWRTIAGLEVLYLSSNGSLTQAFSDALFERLDSGSADWDNSVFVEELVRQTFGSSGVVNATCIRAVKDHDSHLSKQKGVQKLASVVLTFHYPWPIENIIPPATLKIYQNVYTFLLQISRAKTVISRQSLNVPSFFDKRSKHGAVGHGSANATIHHTIRHRLLWLVGTLQDYLFNSTIASTSLGLRAAIEAATNMDAMIEAHSNFISDLERGCLLVSETASAHDAILSLLDLTVVFSENCETLPQVSRSIPRQQIHTEVEIMDSQNLEGGNLGGSILNEKDTRTDSVTPMVVHDVDVVQQLHQVQIQYQKLLAYVITGLRTAGRTPNAIPAWDILADILDFGL